MGNEIRHPATIDKAGLSETAKHYGSANASSCTIGGKVYGSELVLRTFIGTMGKDHLLHGHYVCRIREPEEKELPTCVFRTLPGWEPKAAPPSYKPKPPRANTRKAVTSDVIHPQD